MLHLESCQNSSKNNVLLVSLSNLPKNEIYTPLSAVNICHPLKGILQAYLAPYLSGFSHFCVCSTGITSLTKHELLLRGQALLKNDMFPLMGVISRMGISPTSCLYAVLCIARLSSTLRSTFSAGEWKNV